MYYVKIIIFKRQISTNTKTKQEIVFSEVCCLIKFDIDNLTRQRPNCHTVYTNTSFEQV